MRVERCVADDMRQAMIKVRETLGHDALILSNRRVNGQTEIIAAVDDKAQRRLSGKLPGKTAGKAPAKTAARRQSSELNELAALEREAMEGALPETPKRRTKTEQGPSLSEIKKELSRLRNMFEGELSQLSWREMGMRQPNKVAIQKRLESAGLNAVVSNMIAEKVMPCKDLDQAWKNALKTAYRLVHIPDHSILEEGGIISLLGATGVGKTTTAAKIAAQFAARFGENEVALISADNLRTGGKEQLLSYGSNLGIAVQFASTREEMERTLISLSQKRLVIIDNPGMSQRDIALADRLRDIRTSNRKIHSCLVLSATTQEGIINEIIKAYGPANLQSAIVTHTDECASLGPVMSNLIRHQLPLALVGNGPRVPDDLRKPDARLLINNLVNSYRDAVRDGEPKGSVPALRSVVNG